LLAVAKEPYAFKGDDEMRALALFSGGLDSALAIRVVQEQGIEVIALNFVSHFFGGKNEKAENMAKQLGIKLEYVDFKAIHTEIVKNPPSGRGKNINPCIDCHALMFKVAAGLLEKYDAKFLISGEVLGQRPMSQNYNALGKVQKLSEVDDLIVRPLCAKNLPETRPEKEGWIDRSKLLDIQGRSRKIQMAMMAEFGLVEYPSPGGGCLLTDPNYSNRLKIMEADGLLEEDKSFLFYMAKVGRMFRLGEGRYLFVGRENEDNLKLSEQKDNGSLYIVGAGTPGPAIIGYGEITEEDKTFAMELFSRYSKGKGKDEIQLLLDGEITKVDPVDLEALAEKISKYQYMGQKVKK